MEDRLLTTLEVAEKLGVHRTRINVLIQEGRLPAARYGKSFLVKESDLALVAQRKAGRPKKDDAANGSTGAKTATAAKPMKKATNKAATKTTTKVKR